jgi:hypothetical protein
VEAAVELLLVHPPTWTRCWETAEDAADTQR